MNEIQNDSNIWIKGVKTICGHHKKALLDYVDALNRRGSNDGVTEILGSIKAKVHNDISQLQFSIGVLFQTYMAGGTIKPFEDSITRTLSSKDKPNANTKLSRPNVVK